ncbi:ABC-type transport auxiliary lipoprotein family protein [Trinickia sp.]|jgi:cholesterol transport system auxiliary component|uniref:ABC-type transport auxiliary lipoprotein family protein n=1 Tax=Trinickia sp. TaxID=2571163 RepID=UPI0039C952CE
MIGALLAVLATLGCAVGTPSADNDFRYDLGPAQAQATLTQGDPQPAVRVFDVRAPRALDSNAIIYRLNYVDPRRAAAYAHSHWTMPPALLLTQRLRAALSAQGTVAAPGAAVLGPLLTVDLDEFEQVFDAEGQSHGALTARATLTRNGQVMAQRTFVARAPSEMPNAAGGVGALAVASDDFIAQLIAWLDIQASVAAR